MKNTGEYINYAKETGSTADSIYTHKTSTTINNGGNWTYIKAPEFIKPVIINSPRIILGS